MRRDMAFFIAKIRIRLETSGNLHTIRQEAEVARDYHVNESPMKHHPWYFPGKYHY